MAIALLRKKGIKQVTRCTRDLSGHGVSVTQHFKNPREITEK